MKIGWMIDRKSAVTTEKLQNRSRQQSCVKYFPQGTILRNNFKNIAFQYSYNDIILWKSFGSYKINIMIK